MNSRIAERLTWTERMNRLETKVTVFFTSGSQLARPTCNSRRRLPSVKPSHWNYAATSLSNSMLGCPGRRCVLLSGPTTIRSISNHLRPENRMEPICSEPYQLSDRGQVRTQSTLVWDSNWYPKMDNVTEAFERCPMITIFVSLITKEILRY